MDLSGVARNRAVNLSFDLLGFGQDNSHVTLSDIRVSGLPELHDDAATLPEDNLLTFDPFAQADAQLKPLLAAHIVDAPTHGSLAVNADGTFAYTPNLDYFGTDSFSYRLSDGPLDSNLAIVSLSVTPVNDAPVTADVALTTAEDTPQVIALGAYGSDVDTPPDGTTSHSTSPSNVDWQVAGYPQPSPASWGGGLVTQIIVLVPSASLKAGAITPAGDANNHFIVWSSGDKMKDAGKYLRATVNPAQFSR